MITEPHYHFSTGHDSKNSGNLYPCPSRVCCIGPAWDEEFEQIPL